MRRIVAVVLTSLLLVSSALSARDVEQAPGIATHDFSGTWVLDTERSWIAAPEREPLAGETLRVRQTPTALMLDGDTGRNLGASSIRVGERVRTMRGGETRDVQSHWVNGRLVVTTGWSRGHATGAATLIWSMSADGRELTLDGTSLARDFSRPNTTVSSEVKFWRVYRRER